MPYKSAAQRGYFNANRAKLEKQGVDVDEWNRASKGKKLPYHKDGEEVHYEAQNPPDPWADPHGWGGIGPTSGGTPPGGSPPATGVPIGERTPTPGAGPTGPTTNSNPWGNESAPFSNFGQNMGQPMNPWDMTWGGMGNPYSAPLDPTAARAIGGTEDFVTGQGMGFGGAQNYLQDVLSGKYLTPGSNPYLAQIQKGMEGIKNDQDALAQRQIGSSMAAGGNALSGARMEESGRYQNLSNANFQKTMGDLLSRQYQLERGIQNQVPGQEAGLARTYLEGLNQQLNAGMIPTNMSQADLNRQYSDWQNQANNMYRDYTNNNQLYNQLIHSGYTGSQQPNFAEGLLSSLLGAGSPLSSLLNKLLNPSGKPGGSPGGSTSGGPGGNKGGGQGYTNPDGSPYEGNGDLNGFMPGDPYYDPQADPASPDYNPEWTGGTDPYSGLPSDPFAGDFSGEYAGGGGGGDFGGGTDWTSGDFSGEYSP